MPGRYAFQAISPDTFRVVEFEIKVPSGLDKIEPIQQAPAQIAGKNVDGLKARFKSTFAPWRIANFLRLHPVFGGTILWISGLVFIVAIFALFGLLFFAFFRIAGGGNSEVNKNINLCHQAIDSQLYESAIEYCDEVLKVTPNNGNALNDKGAALYGLGKYQEAAEYFIKALVVMPNDPVILMNQCDVLQKLGKHQAAMSYCDKALSIDPSNARAQALKNASQPNSALAFNKEEFMSACLGNKMTREECIKAFCRYLVDPSVEPECALTSSFPADKEKFMKSCIGFGGTKEGCIRRFCSILIDPALEPECEQIKN